MSREIFGYIVGVGVCIAGISQGYSKLSPIKKTETGAKTNSVIATPGPTQTVMPFFDAVVGVIALPYLTGEIDGEFESACKINPNGCNRFFKDSYATATALANPQSTPTPDKIR